jgi:hypothetical protein
MKNMMNHLGIIFFAAIIMFAMTTCENGSGGGGGSDVSVRVRASNNGGQTYSAPLGGILPRAADTAFSAYTDGYDTLGTKKADITPTKLIMGAYVWAYASNGEWMTLGEWDVYDFAKGITVDIGEIPSGITCSAMSLQVATAGGISTPTGTAAWSVVEFPWPADLGDENFSTHLSGRYSSGIPAMPPMPAFEPTSINGKATVLLGALEPSALEHDKGIMQRTVKPFEWLVYGAGSRRMYNGEDVPINSIIPGLNSLEGGMEVGNSFSTSIVTPFTPFDVPSDADSITLNISLNLNGIISRYEGETDAKEDDVFILKNGWWNDLQMTVAVQQ